MRDLFRLVAVAALSFAVVGLAMLYSRGDDVAAIFRSAGQGMAGLVPQSDPSEAAAPPPASPSIVTIPRPDPAIWVGLAGLPDATEVRFPLPRQQDYRSGVLALVFDTSLAQGGEALLTLSVNGSPRGQVIVEAGEATHSVRIALAPADLAGDEVVLQMAARGGTGGEQTCTVNAASAVTLRPDSGLELDFADAEAASAAAVQAATRPFALSAGSDEGDAALSIWSAQRLGRAGFDVRFGQAIDPELPVMLGVPAAPGGSLVLADGEAVTRLVDLVGYEAPLPAQWPVSLAAVGADTGVKSFRGQRQWTVAFAAADLPGGQLPQALALKLAAVRLADGGEWALRVTLNDNLIQSRRFPGDGEIIALDIDLPAERLLPNNVLGIELVDTAPRLSECGQPEQVSAQLLPESALVDPASATEDWPGLIQELAGRETLSFASPADLTLTQSSQASAMLGMLLGRDRLPDFAAAGQARIAVATRDTLAQELALLGEKSIGVVLPSHAGTGAAIEVLSLPSAELGAALDRLEVDDVILLVAGL